MANGMVSRSGVPVFHPDVADAWERVGGLCELMARVMEDNGKGDEDGAEWWRSAVEGLRRAYEIRSVVYGDSHARCVEARKDWKRIAKTAPFFFFSS